MAMKRVRMRVRFFVRIVRDGTRAPGRYTAKMRVRVGVIMTVRMICVVRIAFDGTRAPGQSMMSLQDNCAAF